MSIKVPEGLKGWNKRIAPILQKPFPPIGARDRKETPHWDKISTWSMLCEELLDTEPDSALLKQYHGELLRRGFQESDIQEMRHFAWLTAGWLNFEKCAWEWGYMDESDIKMAIEWQRKDGLIGPDTEADMVNYLNSMAQKGSRPVA